MLLATVSSVQVNTLARLVQFQLASNYIRFKTLSEWLRLGLAKRPLATL